MAASHPTNNAAHSLPTNNASPCAPTQKLSAAGSVATQPTTALTAVSPQQN